MGIRETLLTSAPQLKKITTPLGDVYVKHMSGAERNIYQTAHLEIDAEKVTPADMLKLQILLLSLCLCNEVGTRLFETGVAEVGNIDGTLLDVLGKEALTFNLLTKESQDALEKK